MNPQPAPASRVQHLEAGWTEVRGEPFVALPRSEYDALVAIADHLRRCFGGWQGRSSALLEQLDEARRG